ncbi:hypothetical protein ACWV26_10500 [Rummeliibacillus sp. JY-2-4R]
MPLKVHINVFLNRHDEMPLDPWCQLPPDLVGVKLGGALIGICPGDPPGWPLGGPNGGIPPGIPLGGPNDGIPPGIPLGGPNDGIPPGWPNGGIPGISGLPMFCPPGLNCGCVN